MLDPTRLAVVSVLSSARWAEFAFVRSTVAVSASALSKQIGKLEDRGYADVRRGYVGKRPGPGSTSRTADSPHWNGT
ncbi:transcriptional regulator [Streptomyces sp. NPDC047108]|uniref:transcriptional regulator n=1 Tax=Streptomyces sp. NPDC047108 TaxID=3155025 RepID=UPI0033FBB1D7